MEESSERSEPHLTAEGGTRVRKSSGGLFALRARRLQNDLIYKVFMEHL